MSTAPRLSAVPLALLGAAVAIAIAGPARAWTSSLYPADGNGGYRAAIVNFAGRDWRLQDFSYTGYQLGATAPATGIACTNTRTITATGDIAAAVQAAVDAVGSAGGGTILIPAGSYTIGRTISVPYGNVSILGAGSGRTVISVPASYRPLDEDDEGLFQLGSKPGSTNRQWLDQGAVLGTVASTIREGDTRATVTNAANLAIGQWIVLQQYYWSSLSQRNDSSGTWLSYNSTSFPPAGSPNRRYSFVYLRKIVAKAGNLLTLDAPLPVTLDPANNPIGIRSTETKINGGRITLRDNTGIAGMTIRFADNGGGAGGFPVGIGVHVEGVRNGWVHDVQVQNFPRFGFVFDATARLSITDSAALRAQNTGGNGRGYGFLSIDSQNLLLARNYVELARHSYTNQSGLNSMLVYSQNDSVGVRENGDDMHAGLAQAVLWDRHGLSHGSGLMLSYRGAASSNAQESNYSSVVWNATDNGYRGTSNGGVISVNPSVDGYGIVVGGPTQYPVFDDATTIASGARMQRYGGLQVGPPAQMAVPGARNQNVLYEGLYTSGLTPASLWQQQVVQRLGQAQASFASSACAPAPVVGTVARSTYTGSGHLVFNGDQLGWSTAFGTACPGNMENGDVSTTAASCKVSAQTVNQTAGGRYAMSILPTATVNGVVATLGGPMLSTASYGSLRLSVFPTSATLRLNLLLGAKPYVAGEAYPTLGTFAISGLIANRWNTVSIPMSRFNAGSFNAIILKSVGTASVSLTYLDDISFQ